jgi:hypothetical protein
MKKIGIIILSIGLLFTLTTFGLLVNKRANPEGTAQIKIHHEVWKPMLGAILIVIGVGIYKVAKKDEAKNNGIEFWNINKADRLHN